ncbi:MAG: DUF1080 domain-containing protein [Niabella sp.]|nr:DUF1080 domain-containing protein [Niabella sp.]
MYQTLLRFNFCILLFAAVFSVAAKTTVAADSSQLIGRWDITIDVDGKPAPAWLEVNLSGNRALVGSFMCIVGSVRPVAHVYYSNEKFHFSIPPQWEKGDGDFQIDGALAGEGIEGCIVTAEGKKYNWKGVRAPWLNRTTTPVWGAPINLFNGKNTDGWRTSGATNQWIVKNGVLTSPHSGSNLISEKKFTDFKLHVEFRYQKGSNSGVYLRGRYETQIEDSPKDKHPDSHLFSGIYGFLPPTVINALGPDQWQTYDITLVGRMVTVVANGKTVICNQEIPGITGGALDSDEGAPGPIYIQGDHGPIEFRKIVITPAK